MRAERGTDCRFNTDSHRYKKDGRRLQRSKEKFFVFFYEQLTEFSEIFPDFSVSLLTGSSGAKSLFSLLFLVYNYSHSISEAQ